MNEIEKYKKVELETTIPSIELNAEEICSVYAYFYSPQFKYGGEWHDAWELVFVGSGEVVIETPEYERIVSKNQIFIHPPLERHKIRANNVSCNMYFISFKCGCSELYEIACKILPANETVKRYISQIISEGEILLAGKNNIAPGKNIKPSFANGQMVKNLLELLLIDLIRESKPDSKLQANSPRASTPIEESICATVVNFLKANLRNNFRLSDIAIHSGFSCSHLCSIFKKTMGMSIINYFIKMRITEAKRLIAENNMTIDQIGEYLNFDSVQHFSAQFKKYAGISPTQYRAAVKQNYSVGSADELIIL